MGTPWIIRYLVANTYLHWNGVAELGGHGLGLSQLSGPGPQAPVGHDLGLKTEISFLYDCTK